MYVNDLMVRITVFGFGGGPRSFPGRDINLLLNSGFVNVLLKTNGGRDRRPNFVIFINRSALIVGGCLVVAWSRKSYLGSVEIISFVFLVLFKDVRRRVSQRFHHFVFDVHQENEEAL